MDKTLRNKFKELRINFHDVEEISECSCALCEQKRVEIEELITEREKEARKEVLDQVNKKLTCDPYQIGKDHKIHWNNKPRDVGWITHILKSLEDQQDKEKE